MKPYARVAGGTAPLYLLSDVEAAAARQTESGYVVEAVARGRQEFRMRRDERAAARESAETEHRAAVPSIGAPTGAWMA